MQGALEQMGVLTPAKETPADVEEAAEQQDDQTTTTKSVRPPRVGGVEDDVVWTGGSNMKRPTAPADIMCLRPTKPVRHKMTHQKDLKEGIQADMKIDINASGDDKMKMTISSWTREIGTAAIVRGFDTVFRVCVFSKHGHGLIKEELFLPTAWGQVTSAQMKIWVEWLEANGDEHDRLNLRLSGFFVRASLGPSLLARVNSLIDPRASGPEVLLTAVQQIKTLNANVVRAVCNELSKLILKNIPGENVATLGEMIMEKVNQIEAAGRPPDDLMILVIKPYTTGTQEIFRTLANVVYTTVLTGEYKGTAMEIVAKMNASYMGLISSEDYEPANEGKKDEDSKLQAMFSALQAATTALKVSTEKPQGDSQASGSQSNTSQGSNGKADGRRCFKCNAIGHVRRNCPQGKSYPPLAEWRKIAPKGDEPKEKTVEGILYKHCEKCRQGNGLWMGGDKAHFTADHRSPGEAAAKAADTKAVAAKGTVEGATQSVSWANALTTMDFY